jgi:hypothetical protein
MKNNSLKILVIICAISFYNCSDNNNFDKKEDFPYYQFTQDDRNNLIQNSNIGSEIVYKNQDNELIKFKIKKSTIEKTSDVTNSYFGGGKVNFYYDNQKIIFEPQNNYTNEDYEINFQKYPIDSDYTKYPVVIGNPKFFGSISFPLWNGYYQIYENSNSILINFNIPTTSMTFNGKTYSKVRIFDSNKTVVLNPTIQLPYHPRNVNIIYYDYNYGIIGFDDLNGKLWRVQ